MKVEVLACDFCGKSQHEVDILIKASNVCICDECVKVCVEVIEDVKNK